jgi:hypothetical protein
MGLLARNRRADISIVPLDGRLVGGLFACLGDQFELADRFIAE